MTTLFTGQVLRGYQIQQLIPSRPLQLWQVYHARRLRDDSPVRLHWLPVALYTAEPHFISRIDRNFPLLIRLAHAHLVPVPEFWHDDSGLFIITAPIGNALQQTLTQQRLNDETITRLMAQLTDAVDYLHASDIIHRDIRPELIFLDAAGTIALDVVHPILTAMVPLPHVRTKPPEPDFYALAPEQFTGYAPSIQTDIYALGVLLYHLLTGSYPFATAPWYEIIQQQLNDPLPALLATRPDLPGEVDTVIQKATHKQPDRRYATVPEFFRSWQTALTQGNAREL